ncbi:MAG: 2-C-methyl-D-erythritol 4-phosphate cytidylyltransferase [Halioglobus sp.]
MNSTGERFWGVIPAAGVGSRMTARRSDPLPKQYLSLRGRRVIEHSLEAMLECGALESVMVALNPEDKNAQNMPCFDNVKVRQTLGGATRAESVLAALLALAEFADESDWVVVHDAARPCVPVEDIRKLIAAVKDTGVGGVLAEAIVDTVKLAYEDGKVVKTLNRNHLWRAQTPQVFRLGLLTKALQEAIETRQPITDEASAMESAGHSVQIVAGSSRNLKITVPEDLALAEFYLSSEQAHCDN